MKKVILKAFSLLLVSSLLLSTLGGCTGAKSTSDKKEETKSQAAATAAPAAKLTVEVFDRGTAGQTPPTNNYWTNWIKENVKKELNIDVEFVAVPRSQEVEKLNVLMASNQAPDLSFTYDVNVIYNYYKNNGITDLTEALNTHGADLKKFLGEDVIKSGQYYGKQFCIPARRVAIAKFATFIRKDWLDKLGMPVPTTTEEFYTALKAFKEKNPGRVNPVVPFSMTFDVEWTASLFFEAFKQKMTDEERFVNHPFLVPGYKEGARYLNKLYNEGLISPEFALDRDAKKAKSDIARGLVGSTMGNYDEPLRTTSTTAEMMKNIPGAQFIPVDCFTNYEGKRPKSLYDPSGLRIIVPKTSQRAVEVIKYLNWMSKKENLSFLQFGEAGVHHTMKDGIPVINKVEGEKKMNTNNNIDYTVIVNGVELGDKEKNIKALSLAYPGFEKEYIQAYNIAINDGYLQPTLPIPVDAEAKYGKTLKEKGYEIYAKVVTAKPADFDKTWDAAIQEWLKIGGQEVIDQRKAAWKEQTTKK